MNCQGPECERFAPWGQYCESHYRQMKAGRPLKPLRKYIRSVDLRAFLLESAERFAAAETEMERQRAQHDLMRAATSWGRRSSRTLAQRSA